MTLTKEDCSIPYEALSWWFYVEKDCKSIWFDKKYFPIRMLYLRREIIDDVSNIIYSNCYEVIEEGS